MPAPSAPLPPIRFVLLGGFLGAGKTTMIARLARAYQAQGLTVAVITNDKAADSVDALNLRGQGLHVGELPGVCFCGNVDELIDMVDALGTATRPDVVLAEPVGSCLDMVATVIRPLQQSFAARFAVAPYGVLVKPTHAAKILRNEPDAGVSPKAAYLFRQQLSEADFIAINRCDRLSLTEVDELTRLLREHYPHAPVLAISATAGTGCDAFLEWLDQPGRNNRSTTAVDYAAYAAGEAELGWLNGTATVTFAEAIEVDSLLLEMIVRIRDRFRIASVEAAHVKLLALWSGRHATANLISTTAEPELSQASYGRTAHLQLVVNARVACAPELLRAQIDAALAEVAGERNGSLQRDEWHCFRPGAPPLGARIIERSSG